jgi:hypothetical protein
MIPVCAVAVGDCGVVYFICFILTTFLRPVYIVCFHVILSSNLFQYLTSFIPEKLSIFNRTFSPFIYGSIYE